MPTPPGPGNEQWERLTMVTCSSSVWDRLIAPVPDSPTGRRPLQRTLAQYKHAIARDLDALLNTRVAISPEELADELGRTALATSKAYGKIDLCIFPEDAPACVRATIAVPDHRSRKVRHHVRAS